MEEVVGFATVTLDTSVTQLQAVGNTEHLVLFNITLIIIIIIFFLIQVHFCIDYKSDVFL